MSLTGTVTARSSRPDAISKYEALSAPPAPGSSTSCPNRISQRSHPADARDVHAPLTAAAPGGGGETPPPAAGFCCPPAAAATVSHTHTVAANATRRRRLTGACRRLLAPVTSVPVASSGHHIPRRASQLEDGDPGSGAVQTVDVAAVIDLDDVHVRLGRAHRLSLEVGATFRDLAAGRLLNEVGHFARIDRIADVPDPQSAGEPADEGEPAVVRGVDLPGRVVRAEAR